MWWKIGTIGFGITSAVLGYFAIMGIAMCSEKEQELDHIDEVYGSAMKIANATNNGLNNLNNKLVDHILKEKEVS